MTVSTGMTIGKYELGKKLGQGGFGSVFVARDTSLDREVALKFMHAEHTANPEILRRFLQEARSAAKVVHSGIVTVFECGQVQGTGTSSDGIAFIAMELLNGESLHARLARKGRLDSAAATEISRQIASALEAAHRAGIVHRDLKPDNIFLVRDEAMPGGERVKVLDFGIAKLAQAPAASDSGVHTHSMMVFGTPRYMSPEQCRSAAHIDHRSDIYSLGCILYELVVGKPPFEGEMGELIAKHQMVAPSTARAIVVDIPKPLDSLISRMLAKAPGERPQTMISVQRALESDSDVSGVEETLPPTAAESLPRFTPVPGSMSEPAAAAVASSTTLGTASGQRDATTPKPKSKTPVIVVGLVVAAAGGIVLFIALGGSKDDPKPPPVASNITEPASAPTPPPPSQPKQIELVITSTPPNAEVYNVERNLLGNTPYTSKRAPAEGQFVFFVKADGFVEQRVVIPADRGGTRDVTLVEIPKPPVAAKTLTVKQPPKPPKQPPKQPPVAAVKTCPETACAAGQTCKDGKCVAPPPKRPLKPGELPD